MRAKRLFLPQIMHAMHQRYDQHFNFIYSTWMIIIFQWLNLRCIEQGKSYSSAFNKWSSWQLSLILSLKRKTWPFLSLNINMYTHIKRKRKKKLTHSFIHTHINVTASPYTSHSLWGFELIHTFIHKFITSLSFKFLSNLSDPIV